MLICVLAPVPVMLTWPPLIPLMLMASTRLLSALKMETVPLPLTNVSVALNTRLAARPSVRLGCVGVASAGDEGVTIGGLVSMAKLALSVVPTPVLPAASVTPVLARVMRLLVSVRSAAGV